MSSYNYISVHQDEDVIFNDLIALNQALMKTGVRELIDGIEAIQISDNAKNWQDNYIPYDGRHIDFVVQEDGNTKFASVDDGHSFCGHVTEQSLVWSCFGEREMKIVSDHMTSGKLVLRFEEEGWPSSYYVLTPGSVDQPKITF